MSPPTLLSWLLLLIFEEEEDEEDVVVVLEEEWTVITESICAGICNDSRILDAASRNNWNCSVVLCELIKTNVNFDVGSKQLVYAYKKPEELNLGRHIGIHNST